MWAIKLGLFNDTDSTEKVKKRQMKWTNGWQFNSLAIVNNSSLPDAVTVHAWRKWDTTEHKQVNRTCTTSRYNTLRDILPQTGYTSLFLTNSKHTALVVSVFNNNNNNNNNITDLLRGFVSIRKKTQTQEQKSTKQYYVNTIRKYNWCRYGTQQPAKYIQYGYWLYYGELEILLPRVCPIAVILCG